MDQGFIDMYCERTGPGFWDEPLNAVTNLAFLVSAILLARMLSRSAAPTRHDPANWVLVVLVFLIGIGIALFHTLATQWAMLSDVIPITIFILFYAYLALRRFVQTGPWLGLLGVAVALAVALGIPALTGFGGGSYGAALLFMIGVGLYLRRHPAGDVLLVAAGVFAVSLLLRTVDGPLCERLPIGTHFLWHLLNAVVLYLVTRAMIRFGRAPANGSGPPTVVDSA